MGSKIRALLKYEYTPLNILCSDLTCGASMKQWELGNLAEGSSLFAVGESFQFRYWSFSFYNILIHVLTFTAAYS